MSEQNINKASQKNGDVRGLDIFKKKPYGCNYSIKKVRKHGEEILR